MSTICAIATPAGGALAIVRTAGPAALAATDAIFRGRRALRTAQGYTLTRGTIVDGDDIVDDVLVAVYRQPHSYTGEDATEIICHGSPYILQRVVALLLRGGCQLARPGEYTQRAFLNGKMDLAQAEAVADLIAATNASTHRVALTQMRGGYSQTLRTLRDKLLHLTSLLELELDFSEEDVAFAPRQQLVALAQEIYTATARLTQSFAQGNAIKNGVPVVILGATNVGKSTLLNTLLGDDRSIVSAEQGTTRDIIEDTITIDDICFRFIDTAGIRHTDNTVEQMGIDRAYRAADKAQIIILLTEEGVPYPTLTPRDDQTVIRLVNKTDTFSALTGTGVDDLRRALVAAVKREDTDILVTNLRHYEALVLAQSDMQRALTALTSNSSADIVAENLRQGIAHLSEILGDITPTDVLDNIFSHFCIGK